MSLMEKTMEKWHAHMRGTLEGGLDDLLHDDVVFHSPVVFTPQKGKEITKMYLNAAGATLGGGGEKDETKEVNPKDHKFRYIKEVVAGNTAVLEFERTTDGKYMNGVDIITCDDDGKIIEFKVMMRPLQAVNAIHQQMGAMLEKMKG
ncbi:MAG: hypothetical protein ACI9QQ_001648 [Myxococcota bacterium]|jgi:hypothetical protein